MFLQGNSVLESVKPVFLVSKFFGTMPLKMVTKPKPRLEQSRLAYSYVLLCMAVSSVHAISTPWCVGGDSKVSSTLVTIEVPRDNTSEHVSLLRNQTRVEMVALRTMNPLIVSYMCIGAQLTSVIFVRPLLPDFLADFTQLDLSLFSVVRPSPRLDSRISWAVLLYFTAVSAPVITFFIGHSFTLLEGFDLLWNTILALNNVISFLVELQFINFAYLLYYRFRMINLFLKHHASYDQPSKYFIIYRETCMQGKDLSLEKVESLHRSCQALLHLMQVLNHIYQLQILFSLSGSFIKILFNMYFAISFQYVGSPSACIQCFKIFSWTLFYIARFLGIVITASRASQEANRVKSFVAGAYCRRLPPDLKEELESFLNHASTWNIKFTACGLFTVNTRLIMSAVAAGTTYLVVLVQFRPQI